MPGKRNTFTRSSSLVRPHSETALSARGRRWRFRDLVEAPGTAPGSETLISSPFIAIAGASPSKFNIVAARCECKVCPGAKLWRGSMSLFDLSGKVALITGSTRGIGRAIAERMAEHGARVVISSRSQAECEREAGAINAKYGAGRAFPCTADINDRASLTKLVERTRAQWNAIDILVLNAWSPAMGTFDQMDEKAFANGLTVNLVHNAALVKEALPLLKAKGGSVIFISSIFGEVPVPEALLYGLVKAGLNYMAAAFAMQLAPFKIRANAIAPGLTRTSMSAPIMGMHEVLDPVMENVPLGRPGEADEIAAVAVLLASPGGAFITGQTINVDGGWSMPGKSASQMFKDLGAAAAKRAAAGGRGRGGPLSGVGSERPWRPTRPPPRSFLRTFHAQQSARRGRALSPRPC